MTNQPVPPDYRLRMPGPAAIPERVRAATAQPIISHRGPEFRAILAEVNTGLRRLIGTKGDVFLIGASGSGGMEAALINVLSAGDALLVVENGQFGERFSTIAAGLPVTVEKIVQPWGQAPGAAEIAARVKAKPYRAVVVIHNESATGVVADLAAIGAVLRDTDTLLVVDSVSGVGGVEMRMDEWGVDVLVTASQKCLMCPPGLTAAAVSAKAMRVIEAATGIPRFFFDFRRAKASLEKGETPFTPPVSLILGLHEALRMIEEEGIPAVLERHARGSAALRAGFVALGFPMFPAGSFSSTVTVGVVPDGLEGSAIVRHMYANYRTVIAGQRTKLNNRVIRIGTMGFFGPADILADLHFLECTLRDLGRTPETGSGVAAAAKVLAQ
ncbi:MAG TPA: alanine--glyoxylate aminotransferase family protein [Pseudolabrys sp.]|nr:alanine--glyoxylate aminotransferase family protein [Pseudolabrys sp.]